jgi:hypothetical protein
MNADERGYKDAKAFVFDLRSSAFISGQPRSSEVAVLVARTLVCRVGFSRRLRLCLIRPEIG